MGDNKEFIYIKLFRNPKEVGEFVVSSGLITSTKEELENKIGMKIDEWKNICENSLNDNTKGELFRDILLKRLSEVF